jgi:hypothetical protein
MEPAPWQSRRPIRCAVSKGPMLVKKAGPALLPVD